MKQKLAAVTGAMVDDDAGDVADMPEGPDEEDTPQPAPSPQPHAQ